MLVTKDIGNKPFYYIDLLGETLTYIAWEISASYHHTIGATPFQDVFGRDMIFNIALVVEWRVITDKKQQQVDIDNV